MSFYASKWTYKVPNPNFPNYDLPLKWSYKLTPLIFHPKSLEINEKKYGDFG